MSNKYKVKPHYKMHLRAEQPTESEKINLRLENLEFFQSAFMEMQDKKEKDDEKALKKFEQNAKIVLLCFLSAFMGYLLNFPFFK